MPDVRIGADDFGGGAGRRGIASGYQFFRTCRREVGVEIYRDIVPDMPEVFEGRTTDVRLASQVVQAVAGVR